MRTRTERRPRSWLLATLALWPGLTLAQLVITDNFTGGSSAFNWRALNGACLTAGDGTGTIPACQGLSYYTSRGSLLVGGVSGRLPDPLGRGALRLTNGDTGTGSNGDNQTGAVVSNFTFPTNQGLQVTFTTVTYGGDRLNGTGADGITFFLMDGANPPSVGALGGSLGYSCSNGNGVFDGVNGGYIGLGIDEYGNFSNPGDNTDTGPGFWPGRISLRGAGDTNWASLSARFPHYYPPGLNAAQQAQAVRNTCRTGALWNYSGGRRTDANGQSVNHASATSERLAFNYPLITYRDFGATIANQQATAYPKRDLAVPITYNLKITEDGYLDLGYSVNGGTLQTLISRQRITDSNGPLPASFRFGFSSGTGGGSNVHEITCFKAEPSTLAEGSAGSNTQRTGQLMTGTQAYFAYYHPINSWGQLTATDLIADTLGNVFLAPNANWDGHCTLTGGDCPSKGSGATVTAQGPTQRALLTFDGTSGVPFQWASLTAAQRSALTAGDSTATAGRLQYLRGDRSGEVASGGSFRNRTGVLGDIIDSSPTWVGAPSAAYPERFVDQLYGIVGPESAYSGFRNSGAARPHVVYVGANDGFLHGFRAGSTAAAGTYDRSTNDGRELIAYMPAQVLSTIHSTNGNYAFSNPQYSHNAFVNATPGVGDLYVGGAWRTWLVGGLGTGGNPGGPPGDANAVGVGTIYVLDITNPGAFSESAAASIVVGEWTSATLQCGGTACGQHLGSQVGTPLIRRLHNGSWGVIFGNGLNSASGTAGIYVMIVSPSGARSFRFLDTGVASSAPRNGIAAVTAADLDGDRVTDYVYAGDALGNVWRFDLTSQDPSQWGSPTRVFTVPGGQPITSRVSVVSVPDAVSKARSRVLVAFGTGRRFPQTQSSPSSYATGTHALYGVWDWNMASWNTLAASSGKTFIALAAPQSPTVGQLQTQSVLTSVPAASGVPALRTVSQFSVCWKDSTGCSANPQFGWRLVLPGAGEQVVFDPQVISGLFVVNTSIPGVTQALTCTTQPPSGYTMAVSVGSGGAPPASAFSPTADGLFGQIGGQTVAGAGLNATGSMTLVRSGGQTSFVYQTTSGTGSTKRINISGLVGSRLTWRKIR